MAYAQIDWHDFVVVETVDYQPFEIGNFPPPTTPEEVGARLLIQERFEEGEDIEMQLESDDEEQTPAAVCIISLLKTCTYCSNSRMKDSVRCRIEPANAKTITAFKIWRKKVLMKMEVMTNNQINLRFNLRCRQYLTRSWSRNTIQNKVVLRFLDFIVFIDKFAAVKVTRPTVGDDYLISPITGEKIPASKVQEHMRIGLLDPRWVEQRDKQVSDKMNQDSVYAAGITIIMGVVVP